MPASHKLELWLSPLAVEETGDADWWRNCQLSLAATATLLNHLARNTGIAVRAPSDRNLQVARTTGIPEHPDKPKADLRVSSVNLPKDHNKKNVFTLYVVPRRGRREEPDWNEFGGWAANCRSGFLSVDLWKHFSPPLLETYIAFFTIRTALRRLYQLLTKQGKPYVLCDKAPCLFYGKKERRIVAISDSIYSGGVLCTHCAAKLSSACFAPMRDLQQHLKEWLEQENASVGTQGLLHCYGAELRDEVARAIQLAFFKRGTFEFEVVTSANRFYCHVPTNLSSHVIEPDEMVIYNQDSLLYSHVLISKNPHYLSTSRIARFGEKFGGAQKFLLYPKRGENQPNSIRARLKTLQAKNPTVTFVALQDPMDRNTLEPLLRSLPESSRSRAVSIEVPEHGTPSPAASSFWTAKTSLPNPIWDRGYAMPVGLLHKLRLVSSLKVTSHLDEFLRVLDGDKRAPLDDLIVQTSSSIFNHEYGFNAQKPVDLSRHLDQLMRAAHPYRDHFSHQFQVFLLGCVLLDRLRPVLESVGWDMGKLEMRWIAASLLHDMGYGLEHADKILEALVGPGKTDLLTQRLRGIKRIINGFCVRSVSESVLMSAGGPSKLGEDEARRLVKKLSRPLQKGYHGYGSIYKLIEFFCYGSGHSIKDSATIGKLEKKYGIESICRAIFFHHAYADLRGWRILLEKEPLMFLLALCDAIQETGRPGSSTEAWRKYVLPEEPYLNIRYTRENSVEIDMQYTMKSDRLFEPETEDVFVTRLKAKTNELNAVTARLCSRKVDFHLSLTGIRPGGDSDKEDFAIERIP